MPPVLDMKIKEIRAAVLREWFALPPDRRATESQAAQFSEKAVLSHGLPADSDASATIKGWLVRYTGLNPLV